MRRNKAFSLFGLESADGRLLLPPEHEQLVALSPRFALVGTFTSCTLLELPERRVARHWPECHLIPLAGKGALVHHPRARPTFGWRSRPNPIVPGFVAMLGEHGLEWEVERALPDPHPLYDDVTRVESPQRHKIPRKARHWPSEPLVLLSVDGAVELRGRSPKPLARFERSLRAEWFGFAGWTLAMVQDSSGFHLHDGGRFIVRGATGPGVVVPLSKASELGAVVGPHGLEVLNPAEPDEPRPVIMRVVGAEKRWASETRPWVVRGLSTSDPVNWVVESLLVRVANDVTARWGLVSTHGQWLVPPTWIEARSVELNDGQSFRGLLLARTDDGWEALDTHGAPAVPGPFETPELAQASVVRAERERQERLQAERQLARAQLVERQRAQLAQVKSAYAAAAKREDWGKAAELAHGALMQLSYGDAYIDAECLYASARFRLVGDDLAKMRRVGPVLAGFDAGAAADCSRERPSREHAELAHYFALVVRLGGHGTAEHAASAAKGDPTGRFKALAAKVDASLKQDWEDERKRHEEWRNTAGKPQGQMLTDVPRTVTTPGGGYSDTSFSTTTARIATQMRDWSRAFSYATSSHAWNWRQ